MTSITTSDGKASEPASSTPPPEASCFTSLHVLVALVALDVLLMGFAILAYLIGNATLAATAGGGATALTTDLAHRLLAPGKH